jgi:pyruvate dehydrogenase E1 component alpha subunit
VHLSIGQEAIAVGVSLNLELEDKVVSTHRSHAHYIAKGGDLFMMLSELIGSPLGCCKGRGGSMHIFDKAAGFMASVPIVGSSLPIATGLALAEKRLNSENIVVAFIGDASLETGAFYESLNLAALKKLPILVVLEDNGYSTYSNKEVRWPDNKNVKETIEGMGITYYNGSGDDVEDIYAQIGNITSDVRNNKPSLVHLDTFRRYEHCGPSLDDSMGYRKSEEIESYISRDPIKILGNKMISSGIISETLLNKLSNQISYYIEDTFISMLQQNENYLKQFEMDKCIIFTNTKSINSFILVLFS